MKGTGKSTRKARRGKPAPARTKKGNKAGIQAALEERRFRALIENSIEAIALLDGDGKLMYDSPAASGLLGLGPQEWIGKSVFDLIHTDDIPQVQAVFTELLKVPGQPVRSLFRVRRKDDSWLWIEAIAANRLADEAVGAIVVNYRDVTEQKRAQTQIEHQAYLLENIHDAVIAVDENFRITAWNRAAETLYGWRTDEVLGRLSTEIIRSEMSAEKRESIIKELRESGSYRSELVQYRKDGTPVHVETNSIGLFDERGRPAGILSVNRDITDRKRAEDALHKTETLYTGLFENMLHGFAYCKVDFDAHGRACDYTYLVVNKAYESLTGLNDLTGKKVSEVAPGLLESDPTYREILTHVVRTGKPASFETHAKPLGRWYSIALYCPEPGYFVGLVDNITERRQAEQALRASEDFRRLIVDTEPECVKLVATNGELIEMNAAGLAMIEADSLEQVKGALMINIVAPEYRASFGDLHKRVMTGESGTLEFEIIGLKGTRRWLETHAVPLRNGSSQINALLGVTRDITERRQAEDALRRSEERYRVLTEASHDMITLLNRQLEVEYTNTFAAGQLGFAPHQLVGRRVLDFFPSQVASRQQENLQKVIESAQPAYIEAPVFFGERQAWLGSWLVPIMDGGGEVTSILVVSRDITERKQAEEALKRSEQDYRHLFDNANDVILIFEPENEIILEANAAACHVYGFEHHELIGMSLKQLTRDVARGEAQLDLLLNAGIYRDFETVHLNKFGQEIHFLINSSVIEYRGRRAILSLNRDVTRYRQAEEALRVNEQRYRALFEETPISIWEEDFSRVKQYIDGLKAQGVTDLRSYFMANHAAINECAALVNIVDINKAAIQMYQAESREQLIQNFTRVINADPTTSFIEELITVGEGRTTYHWEGPDRTMTGLPIEVSMKWSVAPGHESDYSKVIVSIIDITERKRAEAKIQRQVRHLSALHEIDQAIGASVDLRVTLDVFLKQTVSQLKVDAAAILLFNPGMLTLEYAAWQGFAGARQTQLKLDESHAGRAVLERNTIHIPNFLQAIPHTQARMMSEERFTDYYAVPLIAKGQVKGVLEIFHRTAIGLELDWLDFLETLAGQAAIAIENAQLFDDLQRSNTSLTLAYDATIEGWSRAMDLRDKETEGHTLRVTRLTLELARAMRVNDAEMVHIRRGALLHDIGKLGIPDHILLKMDQLSDEEWAIMRRHPVYAYEMLSSIAYLVPALDIPYAHHEKWDGSGYPRGLKGQQIPLVARIFAIVDVWDAITSDRPYRPAWNKERALEFVRSESGKHFDPQVVDAFLQMIESQP